MVLGSLFCSILTGFVNVECRLVVCAVHDPAIDTRALLPRVRRPDPQSSQDRIGVESVRPATARCNTLCAMTARYRIHHGPMSLSAGSGEGLSQRIPPPPRGAPGAEQANVSADRCHVPRPPAAPHQDCRNCGSGTRLICPLGASGPVTASGRSRDGARRAQRGRRARRH